MKEVGRKISIRRIRGRRVAPVSRPRRLGARRLDSAVLGVVPETPRTVRDGHCRRDVLGGARAALRLRARRRRGFRNHAFGARVASGTASGSSKASRPALKTNSVNGSVGSVSIDALPRVWRDAARAARDAGRNGAGGAGAAAAAATADALSPSFLFCEQAAKKRRRFSSSRPFRTRRPLPPAPRSVSGSRWARTARVSPRCPR